ncbi:MAG: nickel pincer cofactor biosynthesis protein LarC [Candidatus Limivicinus sp.]|nr:nickel pincer cofactor biosynthesis protein LarC [Candidatus Limivicinus sp.]
MKTLYFDCSMGAAGDMLTGALLELYPDKDGFIARMNSILAGRAVMSAAPDVKCGVTGTHVTVLIDGEEEHEGAEYRHHHHHTCISEIIGFISSADVPEKVRRDAVNVYRIIAGAEGHVHGRPVENVHFHEVGSIDALADVLSVCLLMYLLAPERVCASPVNVGGGTVKCAHGVLPVPAPATEYILRGIPVYSGDIKSELCTPTGAALLQYFVSDFGPMPAMRVTAAGYGTGTRDFKVLNAVRVLMGETQEQSAEVLELSCNIDDMSAEELGFAMDELLSAGALDVWFTAIGMKKCRPATMLSCLCREDQREAIVRCIFKNTTTLGVRERSCRRHTLERSSYVKDGPDGPVSFKCAEGWGVRREKPEYEDMAKIARETGRSLLDIKKKLN